MSKTVYPPLKNEIHSDLYDAINFMQKPVRVSDLYSFFNEIYTRQEILHALTQLIRSGSVHQDSYEYMTINTKEC